jgi:hypothetical protein
MALKPIQRRRHLESPPNKHPCKQEIPNYLENTRRTVPFLVQPPALTLTPHDEFLGLYVSTVIRDHAEDVRSTEAFLFT